MSGHLWPLKGGGLTGSLVPSKVGGSLQGNLSSEGGSCHLAQSPDVGFENMGM